MLVTSKRGVKLASDPPVARTDVDGHVARSVGPLDFHPLLPEPVDHLGVGMAEEIASSHRHQRNLRPKRLEKILAGRCEAPVMSQFQDRALQT